MRIMSLLIVGTVFVFGCTMRMAAFAPHPPDTVEHRESKENTACVACHDLAKLKSHQAGDNCLRCHRVIKGR